MSLQKYRADVYEAQSDGAKVWRANWLGGPSLAKIEKCRAENLHGEPRITAYVQGEADSLFSIPAKASYLGKTLNGYLTGDGEGNIVFRHCYY